MLIGAPGTGVTWTLERVSQEWEQFGGAALHAKGEPFASDRKLFPWLTLALPSGTRSGSLCASASRTRSREVSSSFMQTTSWVNCTDEDALAIRLIRVIV